MAAAHCRYMGVSCVSDFKGIDLLEIGSVRGAKRGPAAVVCHGGGPPGTPIRPEVGPKSGFYREDAILSVNLA